jgi:hypothetical protein
VRLCHFITVDGEHAENLQNFKIMTATEKLSSAETVRETLDGILDSVADLDGFDVEISAEDQDEWPIPPWDIEKKEDDEISRVFITVSVSLDDSMLARADDLIAEITAKAAAEGITLLQTVEFRRALREESILKFETPNF